MKIEKLITQIAEGSHDALEKLYNKCFRLVYSSAWAVVKNKADAEDVTAEVFITVWNKSNTFRGGNGISWLLTITRNLSLTLISKRKREGEFNESLASSSYKIDADAENKILLENALNVLSEKERETVLLYNSGLKHKEIATLMQEKIGTITWRYSEALKKMRKYLEGENEK